jgi:hypothetical protein
LRRVLFRRGTCQSPFGFSPRANDFTDQPGNIEDKSDPTITKNCRAGDTRKAVKLSPQRFDYGLARAVKRVNDQAGARVIDLDHDNIFPSGISFGQLEPVAETDVG